VKNPNDPIGHRNRNFPACKAVPQSTAPPRNTDTSTYFKTYFIQPTVWNKSLFVFA